MPKFRMLSPSDFELAWVLRAESWPKATSKWFGNDEFGRDHVAEHERQTDRDKMMARKVLVDGAVVNRITPNKAQAKKLGSLCDELLRQFFDEAG